jgi:hypothetical protein
MVDAGKRDMRQREKRKRTETERGGGLRGKIRQAGERKKGTNFQAPHRLSAPLSPSLRVAL